MPKKKKSRNNTPEEIFEYLGAYEEKVSSDEKLMANLTIDGLKQTGLLASAENGEIGIIVGDLWGYITDVNDVVVKSYGAVDKSEFIGKHLLHFVAKGERGRILKKSFDTVTGGKEYTEQHRIVTKKGQELLLEIQVCFIRDKQGLKIGFIDFVRIIS